MTLIANHFHVKFAADQADDTAQLIPRGGK